MEQRLRQVSKQCNTLETKTQDFSTERLEDEKDVLAYLLCLSLPAKVAATADTRCGGAHCLSIAARLGTQGWLVAWWGRYEDAR
jgi:hypothetical protein